MMQFDVKKAFLYGEGDDKLYMTQPKGFVVKGREQWVIRLNKAIYGTQ